MSHVSSPFSPARRIIEISRLLPTVWPSREEGQGIPKTPQRAKEQVEEGELGPLSVSCRKLMTFSLRSEERRRQRLENPPRRNRWRLRRRAVGWLAIGLRVHRRSASVDGSLHLTRLKMYTETLDHSALSSITYHLRTVNTPA